jgi:hypothetical protein
METHIAVDPTTGGRKQVKAAQMSQLPWDSLLQVAEVAEYGSRKYARHNWRKGYPWSWNFDALTRHLAAWVEGESIDPESHLNHMAHAAWHCLAILHFAAHGRGTDDRARDEIPGVINLVETAGQRREAIKRRNG